MRRRSLGLAIGTGLAAAAVWYAIAGKARQAEEYARFNRPDGRFVVLVMRDKPWLPGLPGQGGDSPGQVLLTDSQGRVLQRARVHLVQMVDAPVWQATQVSIKWVGDWPLPP